MNVKVEKLEKNKVKLEIELNTEKFEEGMQKSYFRNVGKYSIPGFRKGKAPRRIFERHFGEEVLYEEAFNFVGAEAYDKAIEENNIFAIGRPDIDIVQIGTGKSLIFTAEVTVKPEVEITNYKGIEVKKLEYNVTEHEVEQEIERMRQKNARIVTVEDRKLEDADTAVIDFEGFIDEVPFEGGKGSNYDLEIGKGAFIEGFEEQLIGMQINEEREIKVKFPEDYHSKNLAGEAAIFKVFLHSIKAKELPELDDEFAKDVSEFDTLDELKSDIKSKLKKANQEKAKKEMEDQLIDSVVENATIDIPSIMIEKQTDNMIRDFEWRLSIQGANIDTYLKYTNTEYSKFRLQFKEKAEKAVKVQLVLEEIGKREKIEVLDGDVNTKLENLAQGYAQEVEEFKKHLKEDDIEYIKKEVEVEKIIKLLFDNAKLA